MPAYVIAEAELTGDPQKVATYSAKLIATIEPHGGRYLVRGAPGRYSRERARHSPASSNSPPPKQPSSGTSHPPTRRSSPSAHATPEAGS